MTSKVRSDYKICELCGASLDVGERCDCMDNVPKITGRKYTPIRRKDGTVYYFGFPITDKNEVTV